MMMREELSIMEMPFFQCWMDGWIDEIGRFECL